MRLQKQTSRKVGDKEYSKYVLVISREIIREVGWHSGQEIEAETRRDKIILKKK